MPFTPLHMGPGILIKSVLQGSFSLMLFGWAQILMDIQPLLVMISGEGELHGFSHTYIGATGLGLLAALTGKYLAEEILKRSSAAHYSRLPIRWPTALSSALIGSYSHVLLDSLMHYDIQPLWPFYEDNQLLSLVTISQLQQFCLYSGLLGAALYFLVIKIGRSD
ncbi:MAG: metal-dependent hydrolase [Motiliproteus sp.]